MDEVYLNGQFDQAIGGCYTQAILYVALDTLNTIEVIAVDQRSVSGRPAQGR